MIQDSNITVQKINSLLDDIEKDRSKLWNNLKTKNSFDNKEADKLKGLDNIIQSLIKYKKLLVKEQEKNDI